MSTDTNANPNGSASAAPVAPAQPAAQPPAPAKPKYEVDYDPNNPPWLGDRLEQAKRSAAKEAEANARKALLAELGFDDPEVAKKLAADEKKRQDAQKSLETKLAERETALSSKDARNKELEESVKSYAEGQLAGLTEQQKAAVIAVAGTDPPKQLKAIEALRPTWTISTSSQQTQTTTQQTQGSQSAGGTAATNSTQQTQTAQQKPASATGPGASAPPASGSTVVPNHLETYEMLSNPSSPDYKPFAAANYLLAYGKEIDAARKLRGSN